MDYYGFEQRKETVGEQLAFLRGRVGGPAPILVPPKGGKGKADLPPFHRVDKDFDGVPGTAKDAPETVGAEKGKVYEGRVFIQKLDPKRHKRDILPPNSLWSDRTVAKAKGQFAQGKKEGVWEYAGNYKEVDGKAGITCEEERVDFEEDVRKHYGTEVGKLEESTKDDPDWRIAWNEGDPNAPKTIGWGMQLEAAPADGAGSVFGGESLRAQLSKLKEKLAEAMKGIGALIAAILSGNFDAIQPLLSKLVAMTDGTIAVRAILLAELKLAVAKETEKLHDKLATLKGQMPKGGKGYAAWSEKVERLAAQLRYLSGLPQEFRDALLEATTAKREFAEAVTGINNSLASARIRGSSFTG